MTINELKNVNVLIEASIVDVEDAFDSETPSIAYGHINDARISIIKAMKMLSADRTHTDMFSVLETMLDDVNCLSRFNVAEDTVEVINEKYEEWCSIYEPMMKNVA